MFLGKPDEDDESFERRLGEFKASLPDYREGRDNIIAVHFVSPEFVRAKEARARGEAA